MPSATLSRRAYLAALDRYEPAAEELALGHESEPHPQRLRAWIQASLYHRIYGLIAADVRPGSRILDLGAWPGTFLRLCRHVFFPGMDLQLVGAGLDYDDDQKPRVATPAGALPTFRQKLTEDSIEFLGLDLDACATAPDALPTSQRFDVITCMEVIEHLHTPYRLAWLIEHLLNPGGIAVIETNNVAYLSGIPKLLFGGSNLDWMLVDFASAGPHGHERHPHVRFFSRAELEQLMRANGLAVERHEYFYWFDTARWSLKNAAKWVLQILWRPTAAYIVVKARKPQPATAAP